MHVRVYAENARGKDPAYLLTARDITEVLSSAGISITVTVAASDAPGLDALGEADVFVGSAIDTARVRARGRNLKIIHTTSAGVDRYMPLTWLPDGAVFTNSSGIHAEKAGEFGLLAILMLHNHMPLYIAAQRARSWRPRLSPSIKGKRVLIYGMGALGGAIAAAAKTMGLVVWGIQRSPRPNPDIDAVYGPDRLHNLLPEADFLVVMCPLTPETRGVVGAREIALLKPEAGIVNMARAAVMDYGALAAALTEHRIAGAVLDVFEREPLPETAQWWDVPNLIVTPHVSADDPHGYVRRSLTILAENLARLRSKTTLRNVVNPERGY